MIPHTLRCFHSTRRRPQCGSVGLGSFALVYTSAESGNLVLQSYLPRTEGDTICFRDPNTPGSKTCCLWRETVEHKYQIENPGDWQVLQSGHIIGIRRLAAKKKIESSNTSRASFGGVGLRHRGAVVRQARAIDQSCDEEGWEVWTLDARGEATRVPLNSECGQLLVGKLGPMTRVGTNTIAVGVGDFLKVITVGHERFGVGGGVPDDTAHIAPTNRRKRPGVTRKRTG